MNNNDLINNFFPVVGVKISNKCRMSCKFCCEYNQNRPEYPLDNFLKIVDLLHDSGTKRICYTGGEPLLYPYLEQVMKYAHDKGLENVLVSSDGEMLKKLTIPSKYITSIRISVHGLGKSHDDIANFPKAFENIDKALKILNNNYPLQIATVVTPSSYDKIKDIAEWAIKNGVEKYYIYNLLLSGKGKSYIAEDGRISEKEFCELINKLKMLYSSKDLKIVGHPYEHNAECIIVYGNGDVLIDPYFDDDSCQKKIGNIFEEAPSAIINNLSKQKSIWNDFMERASRSTIFESKDC